MARRDVGAAGGQGAVAVIARANRHPVRAYLPRLLALLRARCAVVAVICALLASLVTPASGAVVTIPASETVVVDGAQVLDAAAAERITLLLVHLRDLTTAEVKVLTVASIGDEDIFTFAQRHYDLWKLGLRGKGNGALIVLALAERHVRIHTGYGLEPVLPDSWCGSLSRSVAQDYFKAGKYGAGIERMAQAVAAEIATAQGVTLDQGSALRYAPGQGAAQDQGGFPWLVVIIIVIAVIVMVLRSRSRTQWVPWGTSYGGFGGGGGWGSSGGSSSSSSGSFGGGFSGSGGSSGGGGGGASW